MSLFEYFFPPPPPGLRAATVRDADALAVLHAASFARGWEPQEFERLLSEKNVRSHLAARAGEGEPVGFVMSHVVVPEAEILTIAVTTQARGRGIGQALLAHHLARLAAAGVTTSFLEVEEGNAAAIRLYARIGYEQVGRRKGYYSGTDALQLRRNF